MALTTQILKHKSRDIIALLAKLFTVKKKKKVFCYLEINVSWNHKYLLGELEVA